MELGDMITANAATNAIGHNVRTESYLEGLTCKTDCFKIDVKAGGSGSWLPEDNFKIMERKDKHGDKVPYTDVKLGDILNSNSDELVMIGQSLFDAGVGLETPIRPMLCGNNREIWTNKYRFKVENGRVYGHRKH